MHIFTPVFNNMPTPNEHTGSKKVPAEMTGEGTFALFSSLYFRRCMEIKHGQSRTGLHRNFIAYRIGHG